MDRPDTAKEEHGATRASRGMDAVRVGLEVEELDSFDDCNARDSEASDGPVGARSMQAAVHGRQNEPTFEATTVK